MYKEVTRSMATMMLIDSGKKMIVSAELERLYNAAITLTPPDLIALPTKKQHGPVKKGRGGKVKRW